MINERNFDRVRGMLEKTKGRVVFGGEKLDRYFFLMDFDDMNVLDQNHVENLIFLLFSLPLISQTNFATGMTCSSS